MLAERGQGDLGLISDLMDKEGYEKALRFLVTQQMDVYFLHALPPEELDPEIKGDLRLIDCEDEDVAEITVSRPLLEIQADAGFFRRWRAGILHAPRDELPDGQHRDARRDARGQLFAEAAGRAQRLIAGSGALDRPGMIE